MTISPAERPNLRHPLLRLLPVVLLFLAACTAPASPAPPGQPSTPVPAPSATPAPPTAAVTATPVPPNTPTPTALPPSPTPAVRACTPLEGFTRLDLEAALSNPYAPPRPGSDDPHMGADFAVREPQLGYAVAGHPVHAVLAGSVAGVVPGRFPYGFAVIVETPLDDLPPALQTALSRLPYSLTPTPPPALTCPGPMTLDWDAGRTSLYLLYAHLQSQPALAPGGPVACGDFLAPVGESGNALHPHLHLEARVGPSGARFPVLAHYDSRALPEEMDAYCTWRVSGVFALLDPWTILAGLE